MHTFVGDEGTRFHYNGDFSGEALVVAKPEQVEEDTWQGEKFYTVHIPVKDILSFVASYVRDEAIGRLEQMEDDELLSLLRARVGA